jgi:phenolic acid decarboxylase
MLIEPWLFETIFAGLFMFVGYKIGYWYQESKREEIVSSTIDYLIEGGFVKHRVREDGDIDLIQIEPERKE